ncbi:probable arabinosyltransferase ARAD1 isoform X2 [Ananas comosus]|uniref:Probable arabinosyltransferase ARAD1 isoform X2 n=1 Tax=Ananas comosus TaxID=4615 RepID=A0A6P5GN69_ANACO|nr:probable arabinosyltransferase ARAD1 isoform X2 [Ananas comosus]
MLHLLVSRIYYQSHLRINCDNTYSHVDSLIYPLNQGAENLITIFVEEVAETDSTQMLDKTMQPSTVTRKILFRVISLSIFLIIFSCLVLLKNSSRSYIIPETVLMLVLANKTSEPSTEVRDSDNPPLNSLFSPPLLPLINRRPASRSPVRVRRNAKFETLKVYMYDLPPEFHFGMLDWKGRGDQIWPDVRSVNRIPRYPGGLNLQHSIEYWLILDLLSSTVPGFDRPCSAVRVTNSSLADVIFVPFFSSLSYNRHSKPSGREKVSRNRFLQDELVKYLRSQEEWRRGGGRDHLIVAHHPNSMLEARRKLGSAMFVLADFGRYPVEIANLKKDIIAPYRHVVDSVGNDSAPFEKRRTLAYFQGAIYRKDGGMIRQTLYQLLKNEKDVHFTYGTVRQGGIRNAGRGMASSKFCLNIAGDTPSSNRLFDAIVSHCVPVIISDDIELPFEDVLDYSEFCVFIRASDAVKKGFLVNVLRGTTRDKWTKMWQRLKQIAHHFEFQYPSKQGDAVQMIWEAVARKISSVHLELHRKKRYYRTQLNN